MTTTGTNTLAPAYESFRKFHRLMLLLVTTPVLVLVVIQEPLVWRGTHLLLIGTTPLFAAVQTARIVFTHFSRRISRMMDASTLGHLRPQFHGLSLGLEPHHRDQNARGRLQAS